MLQPVPLKPYIRITRVPPGGIARMKAAGESTDGEKRTPKIFPVQPDPMRKSPASITIDEMSKLSPQASPSTYSVAHPVPVRSQTSALGAVYGATSSWPGRAKTLEVTGTKGTIVLRDHAIAEWTVADGTPPPRLETAQTAAHGSSRPDQLDSSLHRACFEAFAAALEAADPYPVDVAAARRSINLIESIYARRDALVASAHSLAAPVRRPRPP